MSKTQTKQAKEKQQTAILQAIEKIEKQFGKGTVMRLGEGSPLLDDIEVISTGSLGLNMALGIGGYPKGRIVEIYGPESSGKTTLTLHAIAEVQRQGGVAAFIDAEHAFDVAYAKKLGVVPEDLLFSQPDNGEQALAIGNEFVQSGALDLLVVDSVAALVPKAEIEGEMGDSHVGLQARLMSQAMRKLTGTLSKSKTCAIFINQLRMKIGVRFGSPETTPGGNALKFYSSVRIDVRRIATLKNQEEMVGNRTRVKIVKNKLSAPFKEVEFDILYGQGIAQSFELIDMALERGILQKSGSWIYQGEKKLAQGREKVSELLMQDNTLISDLKSAVQNPYPSA